MADRQGVLGAVSSAWDELKRAIALVPHDRVDVPGVVGPWSVKDLIGHVATWDQEALQALRRYLSDRDAKALVTWPDVDESHLQVVELVSGLAEEEFASSEVEARIRIDTYAHYADHTAQILRWLDSARPCVRSQ